MKALTSTDDGPVLTERPDPELRESTDVLVRVRCSALGLTDLLFTRDADTAPGPGVVLGHQAVGEVVATGSAVTRMRAGDRVVISATVACGECAYCRAGFFAQCVRLNPDGRGVGGVYLGGPGGDPAVDGCHAEFVRVPFAEVGCRVLPDDIPDEHALLLSEAMPLGYFGAKLARICAGDRVAVFGADPAGIMATLTSVMLGAGRVTVVDDSEERLALVAGAGVDTLLATPGDAGEALREATDGRGVQCAVVIRGGGLDHRDGDPQASRRLLSSATSALSRDSTLVVAGVYPRRYDAFPVGEAVSKYVTVKAAACNHSKYLDPLLGQFRAGIFASTPLQDAIAPADRVEPADAYRAIAQSDREWVVVSW
jgi:threonine dehydrogenase-like Zn-dependent dehydrogenase